MFCNELALNSLNAVLTLNHPVLPQAAQNHAKCSHLPAFRLAPMRRVSDRVRR